MSNPRHPKRLLSSRNLEDVPVSVRIGSPYDAPDRLVYELASQGLLHPATNYGVVYRVAFAPILEPGEKPAPPTTLQGLPAEGFPTNLLLRLAFAFPPDLLADQGDDINVKLSRTDLEQGRYQAWVLLTNLGVRWHFTGDGAPPVHPGLDSEFGGGVRFLPYEDLRHRSNHYPMTLATSAKSVDVDLFVFDVQGSLFGFAVSGSYQPENIRWYDFLRGRQAQH